MSDLIALKKWIAEKKHLPQLTDEDVALFLHRNYYDVQKTKLNVESFFSMRTNLPEYFAVRDPVNSKGLQLVFQNVCVVVLPNRTPEGYSLILMKLLNSDPDRYDFNQAVKYLNMVLDIDVRENGTSEGYLYICDIKGTTPKHIDRLCRHSLNKFFDYTKNGSHFRWMGMHYVNSHSNDDQVNEYVKRKIIKFGCVDKVFFFEKVMDLEKIVPLELLPNEMGGSAGHLQELHLAQVAKVKRYRTWFQEETSMRINAAKRNLVENEVNALNAFCDNEVYFC